MKKLCLLVQVSSIISIAAFAGSMLMLNTSLVSFWKQIPPNEFLNWFSNYSTGIEMTTGPMLKLTMLLPLISIILVWKIPKSRYYWLTSYMLIIGIMVITVAFFIDANTSFVAKTVELENVKVIVTTWGTLHSIRTNLGFLSALFALIGLYNCVLSTSTSKSEVVF